MLQIKLIRLYYYVCQCYDTQLQWQVQRFSRNSLSGHITDEELLTIYLFSVSSQQRYQLRAIYDYIRDHWLDYFPQLPSYQTFVDRLNRLSGCLPSLVNLLCEQLQQQGQAEQVLLLDSMPVITCSHKRPGKVARELTDKGYCAVKGMYYFGVKLHLLAHSRKGTLPLPAFLGLSKASEHDLTAARPLLQGLGNCLVVADKAYADKTLSEQMGCHQSQLLTPVKGKRGTPEAIACLDRAYNQLLSTAVSKVRQPIESLFNWLQEKTNLQYAAKVRSKNGLVVHLFGKIAAALLILLNF